MPTCGLPYPFLIPLLKYGLPGIRSRTRMFQWLHEQVGQIHVIGLPISATLAIRNSRKASRAWTYQEGYLSKRCLLLTDRQVTSICNQDIIWDSADEKPGIKDDLDLPQGHTSDCFPQSAHNKESSMFRAMEYFAQQSHAFRTTPMR
jgi:hypothetical protein